MFNTKNKNKGQILVLFALSLIVILGFAALAIDVAYWYHTKNQLQGAADAAALAGAADLTCENYNGTNAVQTSARHMAQEYALKNIAASQNVQTVLNTGNLDYGDIIVGHWDGANFTPRPGVPLDNGVRLNAMKVVARRTLAPAEAGVTVGNNPVSTFFGKIFNISQVNIKAEAIARGCFIKGFTPISVNEYWMGQNPSPGEPTCSNSDTGKRDPYGINHVYPNSFVRPPCTEPGEGTSGSCKTPSNGNVFNNYTFPGFKTKDCDTPPNTITVTENGPLPATGPGSITCPGDPACNGRVTATSGRVLAIVGNKASNNNNGQMYSLLDLDRRSMTTDEDDFVNFEKWFDVPSGFDPVGSAHSNPDKDIVAGYIASGTYPFEFPTSVQEVYQPDYVTVNPYSSDWPYASTSFFDGAGVVGNMVRDNFFDNYQYQDDQYKPGEKIVVTVYDGIVTGTGVQSRTTVTGYARITICGYGKSLNTNLFPVICNNPATNTGPHIDSTNQNTMYGYVASRADELIGIEELFDKFYVTGFKSILVK